MGIRSNSPINKEQFVFKLQIYGDLVDVALAAKYFMDCHGKCIQTLAGKVNKKYIIRRIQIRPFFFS